MGEVVKGSRKAFIEEKPDIINVKESFLLWRKKIEKYIDIHNDEENRTLLYFQYWCDNDKRKGHFYWYLSWDTVVFDLIYHSLIFLI